MKVARFSRVRPVLTATELFGSITAGPDGQVITSIGSNTVSWGSNISDIFVNGTDHVLGPYVNFADGSNTTVTVDKVGSVPSNTIRIHTTGGGSVSFGSNSTRVSEDAAAGASTDSSRADHRHDGIGTITASSSNTMQRGTWNIRAGTGIALALTDTDGDGEFDTTTIVNTVSAAAGGGGGSSSTFGDGKRYVADLPASAHSTDDEFNDTTSMSGPSNGLDAKWSKHNLGTGSWLVLSNTVAPGELFFDIPTGQSADQSIYQTVPAGDWVYAARTKLHYTDSRTMWGIICVNTSGTGVCAVLDTTGSSIGMRSLTTWTDGGAGNFFGSAGWFNDQIGAAPHTVITLRKASGVYSCGISYSDRLLPGNYAEVSYTPSSFTPAYIGFGRVFSGGKNQVELDFFRKVA